MRKLILTLLFIILCFGFLLGKESLTEGKDYWFSLPLIGREASEAIRGDYPIAIWISSKVDTRATISDAETGTLKNVVIRANQVTQVPYGDYCINKTSEVITNLGIHITADDPISVKVYMSYMWTGEAFSIIPTEFLGTEYYTLNMWQDQLQTNSEYRPGQILIIASEDSTNVTYKPNATTDKLVKGNNGNVTMNKGQTFLILAKIVKGKTHDPSTDLSGSYIKSNKPIQVISGHTKVAYPQLQATFIGRNGGFMRNVLIESVLPVQQLGYEYISAPFRYANRKRGVVQNDKGDLIRFVAVEDDTRIYQVLPDGTKFDFTSNLKKQQYYDIVNQEDPSVYTSDKKFLVGQYGKTWLDSLSIPEAKQVGDQPQNPSRSGQGQLITLTPKDRWTDYAAWRSPYSIDDWLYVTFDKKYLNHLYIGDGSGSKQTFVARFGNNIKDIPGTPYAYIMEQIAAGDHYIDGEFTDATKKDKAVFAAYAYGNWDRSKDGFAYGYPIGMNYANICDDSLVVKDSLSCGSLIATASVEPKTSDCAVLFNVLPTNLDNYEYVANSDFKPGQSKTASYNLNIIDVRKPAHGYIKVMTKSGNAIYKEYTYYPEQIETTSPLVDFGILKPKDSVCAKTITISNPGDSTITVNKLYLRKNTGEFSINEKSKQNPVTYPFTLKKGETKVIEVCAFAPNKTGEVISDSIVAQLSCFDVPLCRLLLRTGTPVITIEDARWSNVHIGTSETREVQILNQSSVNAVLTGMNWPQADKVNFPKVDGFTFKDTVNHGDFTAPVIVPPFSSKSFTVYYHPTTLGQHSTRATFTANTIANKLYSDWVGNAYTAVEEPTNIQAEISPNPATDFIEISIPLSESGLGGVAVVVYDVFGQCVNLTPALSIHGEAVKIDIAELAPGVYFVKIGDKVQKFVKM